MLIYFYQGTLGHAEVELADELPSYNYNDHQSHVQGTRQVVAYLILA